MLRVVADSSALILLAKCGLLEIVCDQFELFVPQAVTAEVASEELIKNYPDAALIAELISRGAIKVESAESGRSPLPITLHRGEKDALFLANSLEGSLFATDDGKAIKAARFLRVPFIISPRVIVELFRLKTISFNKARESLEKLGKIGRYSPEIIAEALISLMEEKDGKADNHKDT